MFGIGIAAENRPVVGNAVFSPGLAQLPRQRGATPENRVVRREAEKITIAEFPTLAGLTAWKTGVTYAVAVAAGVADTGPVSTWLARAWVVDEELSSLEDPSPFGSLDMKIA